MIYYELWRKSYFRKSEGAVVLWYWRARGANHEIIASGDSSGYHNKADCLGAIRLLQASGDAPIREREN